MGFTYAIPLSFGATLALPWGVAYDRRSHDFNLGDAERRLLEKPVGLGQIV